MHLGTAGLAAIVRSSVAVAGIAARSISSLRMSARRSALCGATGDHVEALAPLVAAGKATADPPPWDDPSAFHESDPDSRVQQWMRAIWRARGTVRSDIWRLQFVVFVDGSPVGQQDLTGHDFDDFGIVETTSWVSSDHRGRGIGSEMRSAILHLAFDGLDAREAQSEGAVDNVGSNTRSAQRFRGPALTWGAAL